MILLCKCSLSLNVCNIGLQFVKLVNKSAYGQWMTKNDVQNVLG